MILNILIGFIGLGIVVSIHELGHFIAAILSGIEIEVYSLGWGKPIFRHKFKVTEFRLSAFPFGGYCKMKGEEMFQKALNEGSTEIPKEPGSLFGASPLKRIFTYAAGPLSNFLFSIVILTLILQIGFTNYTFENRIVLMSDYVQNPAVEEYPADAAGMMTGDKIIELNGAEIASFYDVQNIISQNPGKELNLKLLRNGNVIETTVTPELDKSTGTGYIGISAWIEPIVGWIQPGSSAEIAGLQVGDRIIKVDGVRIEHQVQLSSIIRANPKKLEVEYSRNGIMLSSVLIPHVDESGIPVIGVSFAVIEIKSQNLNIFQAIE